MNEIVLGVVAAGALFVGPALFIVWLADRQGIVGLVVKKALGALALSIGVVIIGWVVFNIFFPIGAFRVGLATAFRLAVPLAMVWVGWRWLVDEGPGIEEMPNDFQSEELVRSVEEARAKLPWFVEWIEQHREGAYFVKFPIETPGGLIEHIWGYVHTFQNDQFDISLSNDPIDPAQPTAEHIQVPVADVEDWMVIYPDNRIKGAYSLIGLFAYRESRGLPLSRKMRRQKAQLIDAEPTG